MQPIQEHEGHYWKTADAADLCFNEAGSVPPTHITCSRIGRVCLVLPATEDVPVAELELIAVGRFGEGRPCDGLSSTTRWTGDSHRYGAYLWTQQFSRPKLVIIECHGGGMQGYVFESPLPSIMELMRTLPTEKVWDLCYSFAGTQNEAYKQGKNHITRLFLQDRLKRRRRNNAYYMEILPAKAAEVQTA